MWLPLSTTLLVWVDVWLKAIFGLLQVLSNLPDCRRVSKLLDTNSIPCSLCSSSLYCYPVIPHSVTHCLLFIGSRYVTGKNTGFKNFNPRRPCRKCWYRHSRPYVGALVNRLWSINNHASSSSNTGINLQRPLPAFHPHRQQEQPDARSLQKPASGYIQS